MNLSEYLLNEGIKQSAFAALIGETPQNISRYVNGRCPQPDVMKKIYDATDGKVTANDFFGLPTYPKGKHASPPGQAQNTS